MAEKDTKPKTTAKTTATEKPAAAKSSTAKTASTTKPSATAKPAASVKPASETKTATAKTAKPAASVKPASEAKTTAAKPAASSAKPAATAKPAAKKTAGGGIAGSAANKPTAAANAPEGSGIAGSAANKPTAAANAPEGSGIAGSAAKTEAKTKSNDKPAKKKKENSSAVAVLKSKKTIAIISSAVAFILILAIIIGIVVGTKSCNKEPGFSNNSAPSVMPADKVANDNPTIAESTSSRPLVAPVTSVEGEEYDFEYTATSAVGFSSKIIDDNYPRYKPVADIKDERDQFPLGDDVEDAIAAAGSVRYPKYGYTMSSVLKSDAAREALINESDYLTAYGTRNNSGNGQNGDGTYNMMDKDGYLYFVNNGTTTQATNPDGSPRRLYKHSAAEGMYYGGINDANPELADDEPGIVKEVTLRPRGYGSYSVTGVYAPAGEVIKIEMSEADMNATGGITIHIGQALYNGQSNNIWVAKGQMQRFPNILNTMVVNKNTATLENGVYTAYVGSFIGGPLYIRNTNATFTATISGGVRYSHFILGYTTKEEYEENKKSSTPYFDLEVWNYGVLHSGPKYYAQDFSYDDLYKVAVLWEKVSSVTTTGSSQGIVFLYDPFVAAGAAVAFPGRSSVNCPTGWMANSLNYNGIVTSGGWGNFHEYHHNFQGYGVGNGGEVTNNGMTLVSYALFTKISSKRGIESYGGQGLGGWNNYTSATWALNDILSLRRGGHPSNGDQGLTLYSVLLHNFGANNYIQAKYQQQSKSYGQTYAGYFRAWEDITHNNMTYYFKDVLKGLTADVAKKWHNSEYTSMFVPVSSVYQTGRSYMYDGEKKYFKTMQPYVIPYGSDFNIDLSEYTANNGQYVSGSVVIPDNFKYRIKSITQPEHGKIEVVDNYNFTFKPDGNINSGQIIVTLEIVEKSGAFKVDDVDLVLEFEQSHETNKMTLERTTYTYSAETMYSDAKTAYESNFAGYTGEPLNWDHTNPTQNCNTDIWLCTPSSISNFPKADPDKHIAKENTIEVLKGKLYFEEEGKYRIYLRGRVNCAVFITYKDKDGVTQSKSAQVTNGSGAGFYTNNDQTYIDIEIGDNTFVDFTEVLIVQLISGSQASYIGLGYGKWEEPLYRMVEKYYDANDNEVASPDAEGYSYSKTIYYDNAGHEVDAEVVAAAQPTPPKSVSYINAYRSDYEFPDNSSFESDYFYIRNYSYTYSETHNNLTNQAFVGDHGCFFDENRTDFRPEYLFDGDLTTSCSSASIPSAASPWEFTVDLGKVIEANRFVLTGRLNNGAANQNQTPNSITLLVGETLDDMKEIANFDNGTVSGVTLAFNFETTSFRYYKLTVRKTVQGRYASIADITFSNNVSGGTYLTPDNSAFKYGGNWQVKQTQASFGHVYVGSANATMSFKFNGTRLALLSSEAFGKNFEVTIDGKKVTSLELKAVTGDYGASFMSELLEDKEHTVVIKCLGEANIDSVIVYK